MPVRSGSARMRAVATASAIAKLMPTPPTGDIACAASPMNSKPSRYHLRSLLSCISSSFTSSQLAMAFVRAASHGAISATRSRSTCTSPLRICESVPLPMRYPHWK